MHRSYSVRVAAFAIDAQEKWVDNVLSHHTLPGVSQGTQGVARRLDEEGILALAICRILSRELATPLGNSATIATSVLSGRSAGVGRHLVTVGLALDFDLEGIEARLRDRLRDACHAAGLSGRATEPPTSNAERVGARPFVSREVSPSAERLSSKPSTRSRPPGPWRPEQDRTQPRRLPRAF